MIQQFLMEWVALIIPPTCCLCDGILPETANDRMCHPCRSGLTTFVSPHSLVDEGPLDHLWAIGPYAGSLRQAVARLKFRRRPEVAGIIPQICPPNLFADHRYDTVIPVPLHRRRTYRRGYNQAALLARAIGRLIGVPVDYDLLRRTRETGPQVGLTRRDRQQNLRGAFGVAPRRSAAGLAELSLLLVDDVATTGATLAECARVLKKRGAAHVDGFVMARTL